MGIQVADRARPNGGKVRTITLVRSERRNALDPEHLRGLAKEFEDARLNPSVRVVVVTGDGTSFCAGYDLSVPLVGDAAIVPDALIVHTMVGIRACPIPTIARVNGAAFGAGLELAISCDVRIASESATFGLPPAKLAIAYAPEGLARLVALVGTSGARRLALTAEPMSAAEAHRIGLVDELPADLDQRTEELANSIADAAPMAISAMKRTLNALELQLTADARRDAEADRLDCYASQDALEGLRAFTEKRPPLFKNK